MGESSAAAAAARPGAMPSGPRLLDHALGMLLDHVSGADPTGWRFGPLVVVSAATGVMAAGVQAAAAARGLALAELPATIRDGTVLGGQIAAALADDRIDKLTASLARCRLVVVDRVDRITDGDARRAFVHLIDTSSAAGASWCVSLEHLSAEVLGPQCASRLSGGLVVPAPPAADGRTSTAGSRPSPGRVFRAVARHHDVPVETLLGPARQRTVAAARSLAMYLARRLTGLSFHAIGSACGGRDHTTVLHGVRLCSSRLARDPALAADVERLVAELSAPTSSRPPAQTRRTDVGCASSTRSGGMRRRGRRRTG